MSEAPNVLICAGLDPSGGAGFVADVRVVSALGARPVGVVTALTTQNTRGVMATEAVSPATIDEQLSALLVDLEVRAVKVGLIGAADTARAIGDCLAQTAAPLVWDPVLAPTLGNVAFLAGPLSPVVTALAPHLTLVTPNAGELMALVGRQVTSLEDAIAAGSHAASMFECGVLVKGGHLGGDESVDALCLPGSVELLRGPRIVGGEHVHGTGCALSSAIAARLALGDALVDACRAAKAFVAAHIAAPARPGQGAAAIV